MADPPSVKSFNTLLSKVDPPVSAEALQNIKERFDRYQTLKKPNARSHTALVKDIRNLVPEELQDDAGSIVEDLIHANAVPKGEDIFLLSPPPSLDIKKEPHLDSRKPDETAVDAEKDSNRGGHHESSERKDVDRNRRRASRSRDRDRDRDRGSDRYSRSSGRSRDRDHRSRDRDRDHDRDRDRERDRHRDRDRYSSRDRSSDRDRRSHRSRDRGRDEDRSQSRKRKRSESPMPVYKRRNEISGWDQMLPQSNVVTPKIYKKAKDAAQAAGQNKKLYFGNIAASITRGQLLDFINDSMQEMGLVMGIGKPCIDLDFNEERGFSFAMFRSPKETSNAMKLDGKIFAESALKVRRPADYKPSAADEDGPGQANLNLVAGNVADTPYKLFIGGLATHLNEGDVMKLLSMFGQLRGFQLLRDSVTGKSKGYAFAEYEDHEISDSVISSLNGMAVGDKNLVVQYSEVGGPRRTGPATIVDPATKMLNLATPAASLLAQAVPNANPKPSRVLVLMNMLNMCDFPGNQVDEDYFSCCKVIRTEVEKYGVVKKFLIPRPKEKRPVHYFIEKLDIDKWETGVESEDENEEDQFTDPDGYGRVYVEYETVEMAQKAQIALGGRKFDGRMVVLSFWPEERWESGQLEPNDMEMVDPTEKARLLAEKLASEKGGDKQDEKEIKKEGEDKD